MPSSDEYNHVYELIDQLEDHERDLSVKQLLLPDSLYDLCWEATMTMSAAADAGFAFLQSVREEIEAVGEDANLYSGENARTRYYAKHRDSVDGRPEWDSIVNGELFEHAYDALVIFIDAAQAHIRDRRNGTSRNALV